MKYAGPLAHSHEPFDEGFADMIINYVTGMYPEAKHVQEFVHEALRYIPATH